jgi:glycosyltransferase involved in cell wall biosynthesis
MKNILFISSYPLPLYKGSNQHAYFFLKSLANIFNVYCIFFVQPENRNEFQDCLDIRSLGVKEYEICFFKEVPNKKSHLKISKNKYYAKIRRAIHFPYTYMNMATHSHGKRLISNFIEKYSIDIVHCEHFHYAKYLMYLPSQIFKVVVYHDLYHLVLWEKIKIEKKISAKIELLFDCAKRYLFEKMLEHKVDLNIFLNPEEMKTFSKRSVCIPHIVNPEIKYNIPSNDNFLNILFLGGYNHPPNRISVQFIMDSILPILVDKLTDFKIWIVGPGAEKYEMYIAGSPYRNFICIKGFVPDINEVFQNMNVALFPILYGGGVKTKVIEAIAAGLPVVTTPQGISGLEHLPKNCVEVCCTPEEFLSALFLLKNNVSLRKERSKKGKKFITQNYSVEALSVKVNAIYRHLSD